MVDPPNLIPYVTFGYIISRWVSCISARGNLLSKLFQRGWTSLAVNQSFCKYFCLTVTSLSCYSI